MKVTISADLIRAYQAADYRIDTPIGRVVLKIGQPFTSVAGFPGQNRLAIVTAYNPFSEVLQETENAQRQAGLVSAVESAGLEWFHSAGVDVLGEWPPEPSLAILDPTDRQLDSWMAAFAQNAVVVADRGCTISLRLHPGAKISP